MIEDKKLQNAEENISEEPKKKKRSLLRELFSFVEIFVAAFILAQLMTHFVLMNAEVPSESMEQLIEPGDRLFGFRLAYLFSQPERFDIVIFRYPVDESQNLFKVPKDCYLMLGDNRNISLDARFWASEALQAGIAENESEAQKYTYVTKEQILGRAVFKYYPHIESLLAYE